MSRSSLRYAAGRARLAGVRLAREVRGRTRREPPCAGVVPRPPRLRRDRSALRLSHVLTASDAHPRYLDAWPAARRAWIEVAGLDPILVLVAAERDVPPHLRSDPCVHVFAPLPHVHSALQAQCVRLLYPAVLEAPGAVLTADVDMLPLAPEYFHRPLRRIDSAHFVAYRDVLLGEGEIPVCYNAALPETWGRVFGVETPADVRLRLEELTADVAYGGEHGGAGWTTDQRILYRTLVERGRAARDVWILDDSYTGFRRLERTYVEKWGELSPDARRNLARGRYSDFHALPPSSGLAPLNELAVDLALASRR